MKYEKVYVVLGSCFRFPANVDLQPVQTGALWLTSYPKITYIKYFGCSNMLRHDVQIKVNT